MNKRGYKCHKWTGAEQKMVSDHYEVLTNAQIADMINAQTKDGVMVTAVGVQAMIKRMCLTRPASFRRIGAIASNQFAAGHKRCVKRIPGIPYKGKKDGDGYMWFVIDPVSGKRKLAHRWLFEQKHGTVPNGHIVMMLNGRRDPHATVLVRRGSPEHMATAIMHTSKKEARMKAWDTRRRSSAVKTYAGHRAYEFTRT